MVKRAGASASLGIKVHAHMLRHACGFKLANDGIDTRSLQAYWGHSNIQNPIRYTALASGRFKNSGEQVESRTTRPAPAEQRPLASRRRIAPGVLRTAQDQEPEAPAVRRLEEEDWT
jgi:hypothetical protein